MVGTGFKIRKDIKASKENYNQSQEDSKKFTDSGFFNVSDKLKSEFDMWTWIFQEIANLRLEVSRLGTFVRLNNSQSPLYIEAYHSHIYSLLISLSPVVPTVYWKQIDAKWLNCKGSINKFKAMLVTIPNKKIPFELIRQLDSLYRIALIIAQKSGLGIRTKYERDIEESVEKAITGT